MVTSPGYVRHADVDERARILSWMGKHQVPTWMNVCWLLFVCCLVFSVMLLAILRGYDFAQSVGFLTINFGMIFCLALLAGLALYGLSILLEGVKFHRSNCQDDDNSARWFLNW